MSVSPLERPPIPQVEVLGVRISAIGAHDAMEEIERRVRERDRGFVTLTGVHGVMEAQRDPELMAIHNRAALTCPDGMPMVWSAHWAGARWVERVYGPDLMVAACAGSVARGWRHYLYGGGEGVAPLLQRRLEDRYPGIEIVGSITPPFRPLTSGEECDVTEAINAARPDLVWVGLSTPKQERWMDRFRPLLDAPVLLGVGAAFDIHAGLLPQAPAWMQRSGLEWAYRLGREPRRLYRRYLSNNPRFVVRLLRQVPVMVGPRRG